MGEKLVYVIIFIIIAFIGFFHFKKVQQNKKNLIAYIVMMMINVFLLLDHCLEMGLPTPLDFITFIYQPISDFVFGLLT